MSGSIFFFTLLMMTLIMRLLTVILPRVERVYSDFGVELPAVTRIVLSAGRSISGVAAWVIAVPLALATAFVVGTIPIGGRMLRLILVLVIGAITAFIAAALFLPLVSLAQ